MKELTNGIALYDLKNTNSREAYYFAEYLFGRLNIQPNSAYYYYEHEADRHGETVSEKEVSFAELEEEIEKGIDHFRVFFSSTNRLWDVGFSFFGKESKFSEGMSYIEIQFSNKILSTTNSEVLDCLYDFLKGNEMIYGIGYQLYANVSAALNYALCLDASTIYPFEDSNEWLYQLPSRSGEEPQYYHKLRMVYPINILNKDHLELSVMGIKLSKWILSDSNNGTLKPLNGFNYLWLVSMQELERINEVLGKSSLLISWESINKSIRNKLP
ncbi:hypothetical protein RYD26_12370 [Pasteurellaceae bacterium LIM206]|nr:hypothetical protein [Pasteurellaceae bacterium LIM206]